MPTSQENNQRGTQVVPKELTVIGGPNGAGKSTLIEDYVDRFHFEYIGADAIAVELASQGLLASQVASGEEFLRRIHDRLDGKESFIVETTLSGLTFRHLIEKARESGFTVTILFVFLDSADTCVERVRERVEKGGHHVPESDIRRRFRRSAVNFWKLYRPLADHWLLVYNAGNEPQDVAAGSAERFSIRDAGLFQVFEQLIENG